MPEVLTGEYKTRAGRNGVTVNRDSTDLDRAEQDNIGRETFRRERSVCRRLRQRFYERMHTRMYVCTYVCLHARLKQQGAAFFSVQTTRATMQSCRYCLWIASKRARVALTFIRGFGVGGVFVCLVHRVSQNSYPGLFHCNFDV